MTGRERMLAVLELRQPDEVPHFELEFQLAEQEFGPGVRHVNGRDLENASPQERERLLHQNAELWVRVAERFNYSNIAWSYMGGDAALENIRLLSEKYVQGRWMISGFAGGGTYGIPDGKGMQQFVYDLFDRPDEMKEQAERNLAGAIEWGKRLFDAGCELIIFNTDYAFNNGPFLRPEMFREFVTPYLIRNVAAIKEAGAYVILHTDGNLMPVMDQLLEAEPHGLHSIDPEAGMDMAVMKREYGDRLCLMGNLECRLLQMGTAEEVYQAARDCVLAGKPGGGYIFSTSNVVFRNATYPHLDKVVLENYHVALQALRDHGKYS